MAGADDASIGFEVLALQDSDPTDSLTPFEFRTHLLRTADEKPAALAVEVFVVPGFGIPGLLGLASLCGGLVLAMIGRDWELALLEGHLSSAVTVVSTVLVATEAWSSTGCGHLWAARAP